MLQSPARFQHDHFFWRMDDRLANRVLSAQCHLARVHGLTHLEVQGIIVHPQVSQLMFLSHSSLRTEISLVPYWCEYVFVMLMLSITRQRCSVDCLSMNLAIPFFAFF